MLPIHGHVGNEQIWSCKPWVLPILERLRYISQSYHVANWISTMMSQFCTQASSKVSETIEHYTRTITFYSIRSKKICEFVTTRRDLISYFWEKPKNKPHIGLEEALPHLVGRRGSCPRHHSSGWELILFFLPPQEWQRIPKHNDSELLVTNKYASSA